MITSAQDTEFVRPFPALTPNQRLHLEVYGYVIIEHAITDEHCRRLREKTYALEEEWLSKGKLDYPSMFMTGTSNEFFRVDNLPHLDPAYFEYVTDPYLVGLAEEAVGAEVRLEQSDAHIRRPLADRNTGGYGFHRGAGTHLVYHKQGMFHCQFVKCLTNLTDLGPDDGGTTVVAGSHRMTDVPTEHIVAAAKDDPSLIHHVVAPAGSTLLFYEALVHSAGIIKSDNDRLLIIAGYSPTMFATWRGYDPDPEFLKTVDEKYIPLLTGSKRFTGPTRVRTLDQPAADATAPVNAQ